jgi:hypothetical protein
VLIKLTLEAMGGGHGGQGQGWRGSAGWKIGQYYRLPRRPQGSGEGCGVV